MLELSSVKKNKVNLSDYNSQQDIENRIMLADFTLFEHHVLEEILFSSLKISYKKFFKSLECSEQDLLLVIQKLEQAGLLFVDGDTILVDKEMRKYFESQIARFDSECKPDMEFLQGLLRRVPIHVLPNWYAIPRTSSNIFESIVEKYLISPQTFHRYLCEFQQGDTKLQAIARAVFAAPNFQLPSSDIIAQYNFSRREFEEIILLLEFHFVCCLWYVKENDHWTEIVTPFYEWREYLLFLERTNPKNLSLESVSVFRDFDFAFVKDMTVILTLLLDRNREGGALYQDLIFHASLEMGLDLSCFSGYLTQIIKKLSLVQLIRSTEETYQITDAGREWLDLSLENKAIYLHRHPMNRIISYPINALFNTEKQIHEAEKSIKKVFHGEWVYVDDFIQGALVAFDEKTAVTLRKTGKTWKYTLPQYTEEQKAFIRATLFEWLFQAGIIALGTCQGRDCFCITPFGRSFF